MPLSLGLAFVITKAFSSRITCRRRSVAAGKSLAPNFCKAISGIGSPAAEQTKRAVSPESTVKLEDYSEKENSSSSAAAREAAVGDEAVHSIVTFEPFTVLPDAIT
uniref:Uncharacterized protein n=1 Tax=Glossina palpalis gambiensis TaxID=67801 RepID=A0A1B0B2E3_9MUSC